MQQRINIIAAFSMNRVIGLHGKIPWDLPEDLRRFKKLTSGNTVIMGRRTFQEIGKPLPNRLNIIVSVSVVFSGENLLAAHSLQEALELAFHHSDRDIFLCGGQQIYQEGLYLAHRLFLTEIQTLIDGDAFFPILNDDFVLVFEEYVNGTLPHKNFVFERKCNP